MKTLIVTIFFLSLSYWSYGQNGDNRFEIHPYTRMDWYPEFSYLMDDRASTDYIKIRGASFGITMSYQVPVTPSISLKPGIGFYRHSFNDIKRTNTMLGKSDARNINFPSSLFIPFHTDKYFYNSVMANLGFGKSFLTAKNYQMKLGLDIHNYFTFSQNYHLINNPGGSRNYNKSKTRYFGSSAIFNITILKEVDKLLIGPSLLIPVYDTWKTDSTFPEETNVDARDKWFNSAGIGIMISF